MKVVFRTDASIQIGTGHVMRCLTLAEELTRHGNQCFFVCRDHSGHLGDVISGKGFELILLPAPTDQSQVRKSGNLDDYVEWLGVLWEEDAQQTRNAISPLKPDWLIVDHYALDAQWERTLASAVADIMVIDDLANRPHDCTLLLDQNLGRFLSDYEGLVPAKCERLIGPQFALLRPEFLAVREKSLLRRRNPEIKRILISLGGVDPANITGQILGVLENTILPTHTEVDIILGVAAPNFEDVRQRATQLPFKATVSRNVTDMAARMCLADLSIGAAGSTSWERCCIGLPAITIILAENQRAIAEAISFHKAGILVDRSQVRARLKGLINRFVDDLEIVPLLSHNAAQICDGHGTNRVVTAITGGGG